MKPLNQNNMLEKLNIDVSQFWEIIWKFFVGALFSVVGYFEPVKDIVHLLIAFFIIDMLAGFWANKIVKQEKFNGLPHRAEVFRLLHTYPLQLPGRLY